MAVFSKSRILEEVAQYGFARVDLLNTEDLNASRGIVAGNVSTSLRRVISFDELSRLASDELHELISNKTERTLSAQEFELFAKLDSLKLFLAEFSELKVAELVDPRKGLGERPEMYYRIVPPGSKANLQHCHVDRWFDEAYEIPINQRPLLKVWCSLLTEPGANGLMFLNRPRWHELQYHLEYTTYGPRPRLLRPILDLRDFCFPSVLPGQAFIFSTAFVPHVGATNNGKFNRISFEIALRK